MTTKQMLSIIITFLKLNVRVYVVMSEKERKREKIDIYISNIQFYVLIIQCWELIWWIQYLLNVEQFLRLRLWCCFGVMKATPTHNTPHDIAHRKFLRLSRNNFTNSKTWNNIIFFNRFEIAFPSSSKIKHWESWHNYIKQAIAKRYNVSVSRNRKSYLVSLSHL
jgi:hypothetical protein